MSAALCACATDQVSRAEHAELLASVRALRADNARLETRLDRMEQEQKTTRVMTAPRAATPSAPSAVSSGTTIASANTAAAAPDLPSLTVVKLKPKKEAAPKISTEVEVVEPPAAILTNETVSAAENEQLDQMEAAAIEQQYQSGVDLLKTGNPEGGIAALQQFARDWPKHPHADNALFYAAVGLMAGREFKDAENVLEQTIRQYPAGDATLEALVKLAECRARLNRQADARATWEKIVANYPGTQAATLAQSRLASASQKE